MVLPVSSPVLVLPGGRVDEIEPAGAVEGLLGPPTGYPLGSMLSSYHFCARLCSSSVTCQMVGPRR
jgi:hypothetical protein